MLSESEARARLTKILAEILILNEDEIHPGSRLVDDLDADSIAFLELHHRLQHDFGLEVPRPKVTEETLGLPVQVWVPDDPGTVNLAVNHGTPLVQASRRARITRRFEQMAKSLNGAVPAEK